MKSTVIERMKVAALFILSVGVLSGCIEIPYLQSPSGNAESGRYDLRAGEGRSRVFFFSESDFPFAAQIDGINVGSVGGRNEYLRAEIPAGTHVIQWKDLSAGSGRPQGDTQVVVESEQPYVFRIRRETGRLENLGKAGGQELSGKALVLADPEVTGKISRGPVTSPRKDASSVSQPKTAMSDTSPSAATIKDKLSELKSLYDSGLITKDEYDGKRKQLLERWN